MLPLKFVKSITNDRRAQEIGIAISVTNELAGLAYLNCTEIRLHIEKEARFTSKHTNDNVAGAWIDHEWSTHWRNDTRRKRKDKDKKYKFL